MTESKLTKISNRLYELQDAEGNWWTITKTGLKNKAGYDWHADTSTVGQPMIWGSSVKHVVTQIEAL